MKKTLFTLLLCITGWVSAQEITIELFQEGFTSPLSLQHANDERLFVVEQGGRIKIIQPDGTIHPTPFLNISGRISQGGERGLLGLAFHPDYGNNGYFYVNYTDVNGDTRVSRFSVDASNPDLADSNSELLILGFDQPFSNHNGGNLLFGPDGYLYIASGDGGSGGDPNNNGQNINSLLGKLLRIDVDNPTGVNNYGIPSDNPFVGNPDAKEEIYAYGLRNPWRFSVDRVENNIWIADVGQGNLEEINKMPLDVAGVNYGWRCYEGTQPFNTNSCPPASELTFPIAEYSHSNGNCSITGGFVYRGSVYSDITGLYFFADYCSGLIGTVDSSDTITTHGMFSGNWVSFGEDIHKELYIVDIGGAIYKINGGEIVGTEDFLLGKNLSILPNPATDRVSFKLENGLFQTIQLLNIRGEIVYSAENILMDEKVVPIDRLTAGIYISRITTTQGLTAVKKLIVR